MNRELKADTKDIQSLTCERDRIRDALETKRRDLKELLADKEDGHNRLCLEKDELHTAVMAIQDEGEKDLEQLDRQLEQVKRESNTLSYMRLFSFRKVFLSLGALSDKHKQFDKQKKTLKDLLEKTAEALTLKREKQLKVLDVHLKEYQRQAGEKVKSIQHQTEQIKGIAKILPKPN